MIFRFSLLILLCIGVHGLAQQLPLHTIETIAFQGKIGDQHVRMRFSTDQKEIHGMYHYKDDNTIISIKGSFNEAGRFVMTEKVGQEITGHFEGTRTKMSLSGTWYNADRTKSSAFTFTPYHFKEGSILPDLKITGEGSIEDYALVVRDKSGTEIQRIKVGERMDEHVYLQDVNFDGHLDIGFVHTHTLSNTYYSYYVYQPEKKKYKLHDAIGYFSNPEFDAPTKTVKTISRSSACEYETDVFEFRKGNYVLVERTERTCNDEGDPKLITMRH